jgi:hypothetical protein
MGTNILHGKRVLALGDFGESIAHESIKSLVEVNGGKWLTKFDEELTHLITTKDEWEKQSHYGLPNTHHERLAQN